MVVLVGRVVVQGQVVLEAILFVAGHNAVRQCLGDVPGEALLEGLLDV